MKNSILNSTVLGTFLGCIFLSSASLNGMQLNAVEEDSSDETESMSDEETGHEQAGSGLGAFFVSQVAGARELLGYGKRAVEDLVSQLGSPDAETSELGLRKASGPSGEKSRSVMSLAGMFLNDPAQYQVTLGCLPRDIRSLLGRSILRNHPLVSLIRQKLPSTVLLREFKAGEYCNVDAHVDPVGNRIVTHALGCIKLWDTHSGQELARWEAEDYCCLAQFQQPGAEVATVSSLSGMQVIQFWDTASGESTHTFSCRINVFAGSYNKLKKRTLVVVGKSAKVWDVVTGKCICKLKDLDSAVASANFDGSGDRVVTVFENGTAAIWNVSTGACIRRIDNRTGESDLDETAMIWDVATGEVMHRINTCKGTIDLARFDESGEKLVAILRDEKIAQIWDLTTGSYISVIIHENTFSAAFNKAGDKILLTAPTAATIWDVNAGICLQTIPAPSKYFGKAALWNPSGDLVIMPFGNGLTQIWDAGTGVLLYSLKGAAVTSSDIAFDAGGEKIAIAYVDGFARLWDLKRLLALSMWLEKEWTLEQALLLHCIYETRIAHALEKKRQLFGLLRFDFHKCPHLQEHFDSMPLEVQACLEPFIKRCASLRSRGRLPS